MKSRPICTTLLASAIAFVFAVPGCGGEIGSPDVVDSSTGLTAVVGPSDSSFYTVPSPLPAGNHGDLIWYRTATANLGAGAPGFNAWNVLYRSNDALGAANAVTGTVFVPTAAWKGWDPRQIIGYAVGTHGLGQRCAPSLQFAAGTDYESANIVAALNAGYAVLVTDYAGYTNGSVPTYLAGKSQGHAVLDIFTAATQIPSAGLSSTAKVAIWGFSQGGQTATWAGELKSNYTPKLKLVGVAAGGVPADFINTAHYLDGSTGESFLLSAVIGLTSQYPDKIPLYSLANSDGLAMVTYGKSLCVFEALFAFMNHHIADYVIGNQRLDQLQTIPSVHEVLTAQNLGTGKIPVPLYQYHGTSDEFIPLDQATALKEQYCNKWANVTFAVYPGEHIITQFQPAPYVLSWLADRFAGKVTWGSCLTFTPKPTSTANPGGGDFIVSLKNWTLNAKMHLKTLNQDVVMPSSSTMTADTNMTATTITGSLTIPDFTTNLVIAILPVDIRLKVVQTSPITGTASLDGNGQLHVHGHSYVDIYIASVGESILQIPFGCKTSTPVDFPINFDGPVSSLGNGNLTFTGTTTFPSIRGCGIFNGGLLDTVFSLLMSGPGQKYSFTVSPPAPYTW